MKHQIPLHLEIHEMSEPQLRAAMAKAHANLPVLTMEEVSEVRARLAAILERLNHLIHGLR